MRDANAGYKGYSMSIRAVDAYVKGEQPESYWTKREMLEAVEEANQSILAACRNLSVSELRGFLLDYKGYHHISSFFNETVFYAIREDLADLTPEDVPEHVRRKKEPPVRFRGSITYLEWSGPKKHPKATKKILENVIIEERDSFYVVLDDSEREVLRKKKDSNGTSVVNYEEKKKVYG